MSSHTTPTVHLPVPETAENSRKRAHSVDDENDDTPTNPDVDPVCELSHRQRKRLAHRLDAKMLYPSSTTAPPLQNKEEFVSSSLEEQTVELLGHSTNMWHHLEVSQQPTLPVECVKAYMKLVDSHLHENLKFRAEQERARKKNVRENLRQIASCLDKTRLIHQDIISVRAIGGLLERLTPATKHAFEVDSILKELEVENKRVLKAILRINW